MKYTCEIEINKPVDKVVELFDKPENLYLWMEGLQKFEHVSGTPGQPGAKSKLTFQMGKRKIEMIETVLVRNLPEEFSGSYEASGVFNIVRNNFSPMGPAKTKYTSSQEFRFNGFMRLLGALMPGAFRKQSMQHLNAFKKFAENAP